MVSGVHHPKNISNMKSPKSNAKTKRNRFSIFKDQPIRSPRKPIDVEIAPPPTKLNLENKAKSGSWKRRSSLQFNTANNKQPPLFSSSISQPGILYSDVLFSGENPKTLVTIRNLEPRQPIRSQTHQRARKVLKQKDRLLGFNKECISSNQINPCTETISLDKKSTTVNSPPTNLISTGLTEYVKYLGHHLNVEIPSWNFADIETFNEFPKFNCQFDDYNYLTCEKVALVGLRLASDGKFKS